MSIVEISDLSDPRLGDYSHHTDVALRNAPGFRGPGSEHGIYIAESLLVLQRALAAGHEPRSVLALGASVADAIEAVGDRGIPIFSGPSELLEELTGYQLHRGLIAAMNRPVLPSAESLLDRARRVVVLENVVDPTNVGAIFRSAAAIGADAVLVTPRCADPLYRRAIRVSMGAVLQVPWTRVGEWGGEGGQVVANGADDVGGLRRLLAASGFHIAALALTVDAVDLRVFAATAPERVALVLGTEGDGLTPEAIAAADTVVSIPMRHGIDSLNVAATAAVAMWALAAPAD